MEVEGLIVSDSCIICDRTFTREDIQVGDVEVISAEPLFPFGRWVKIKNTTELRLFSKGTAYHGSCYYRRKYRLD